ncbi:A24 family peptidase [Desulfoscipio geothermicus]|uniref:Prepilin peptidase CpaA n=1 Tax=Desulfoscipio geothermicus DSM 3669 TaxID=1121426 RepID=A0A1I6D0X6_9FIRM|nr:prepilin peptidase [Desulfoscipio geothermicus]SFQ99156.1 prepilin peptidase CpaA [Desulfoscipio geothermicus DSM 3669]
MINPDVPLVTYIDVPVIILLLICCYTDLRSRKIYNHVLLPAVVTAFMVNFLNGGLSACLDSLQGLLLGMALLIIPFAAGGMGAGDVKLLGAIGAFKGPEFVFTVFLAGAIAGGIVSLYLLARKGKLLLTLKKIYYLFLNKLLHIPSSITFNKLETAVQGESFPYALALGLGAAWAYILG